MAYKRKAFAGTLAPNIQRGGSAIPIGGNLYWMKGRTHAKGGIDIGKDLEVENNEVMQMLPNETRVFSSIPFLGGNSPAQLVASGLNPDIVFNAQEQYKKVNRIKDDGTKYKKGGKKPIGGVGRVGTPLIVPSIAFQSRGNRNTSLNMNSEEKVLSMANYVRPKNNYEDAVDSEPSAWFPWKNFANKLGLPHSGLSNCTLTASQLYNPARPINHARTITSNPRANGFYEVGPEHAVPGSMVIASNNLNDKDMNNTYHTMILTGYADKDYKYNFAGNEYDIKKGTPLVSYSRGGNNVGDWRTNIPIDVYLANGEGKNVVRYYRPLDKNGNENVLLDEITVTPKKYGGMTNNMNLQNIQYNSLTNSKRTISPNKIGTIVRIDGNGKDKLNYIPSTGSSQQVMKGGGRVKARLGLTNIYNANWRKLENFYRDYIQSNPNYLDNSFEAAMDELPTGTQLSKKELVTLDDGFKIEMNALPEVPVYPKVQKFWTPPTVNIGNVNPYADRPKFVRGVDPIDDEIKYKIKGLGDSKDYHWIKTAGDLLTTGLSTFNNLYYLNKMKESPAPVMDPGVKLPTKISNLSTLEQIRRNSNNTKEHYFQNTGSSQTLRNLVNTANLNSLGLIQQSNEQKSNKEVELMKEDAKQRAITQASNIERYNKYLDARTAFRNAILDKRSETWNNMMSNVNKVINEGIENKERMDAERRQFYFLSYAYPILRNNPNVKQYLYNMLFGKRKES